MVQVNEMNEKIIFKLLNQEEWKDYYAQYKSDFSEITFKLMPVLDGSLLQNINPVLQPGEAIMTNLKTTKDIMESPCRLCKDPQKHSHINND